jgi:hypothetical protein
MPTLDLLHHCRLFGASVALQFLCNCLKPGGDSFPQSGICINLLPSIRLNELAGNASSEYASRT